MDNSTNPIGYASGIISSYLVEWLIGSKFFKWVNADSTVNVKRSLVLAISALFTVAAAFLSGQVDQVQVNTLVQAVFFFAQTFVTSTTWHHVVLKPEAPKQP